MSAGIEAAKAKANDTDYVRKYGPDETYWPHFLDHSDVNTTADDYRVAAELIEATAPEATKFIDHLRAMQRILSWRD